ncbi:MAG TPA: type II toxin-antitoxin system PemK/MazF family toxin [Verrucomicrobiae bacterium]|jgi:mRNA interferase MazF|nr:type II toxin-antitoxin system PemK/MazF family toxin [Verrucomicrobiae bacterium]
MTNFKRGDVVVVDLGMMAKTRPCVVVSIPRADAQRTMAIVVPMTTEIRGGECEVSFPKPAWLKQNCVVNVLGIAGVEHVRIERNIARFPADKFREIETALKRVLAI